MTQKPSGENHRRMSENLNSALNYGESLDRQGGGFFRKP